MLEIELKAHCDDLDSITDKIISVGAVKHVDRKERDLYFNHPSRNFAETDEALRIRTIDEQCIFTYKGPKIGERTKTRFEEEVEFQDLESMKTILLKLGFPFVDEVIKDRTIYILDDIEICIDRVEGVGDFVELEKKDEDREKGEKDLFELAEKLGLNNFERRSYLELMLLKKHQS